MRAILLIFAFPFVLASCMSTTKDIQYRPYNTYKKVTYGYLDVPNNASMYTISYKPIDPLAPKSLQMKFAMIRAAEIGASISMPYFHFADAKKPSQPLDSLAIAEARLDSMSKESRERIQNPNEPIQPKPTKLVEITVQYIASPCDDCFSVLSILADARRQGYIID